MDKERISDVLNILCYLAVSHINNLVDLVQEYGSPDDILALRQARQDLAMCARVLAEDFPNLSQLILQQTSEEIVQDAIAEITSRFGSPKIL